MRWLAIPLKKAAANTPAKMPRAMEKMITRLLTLFRQMFRQEMENIMGLVFIVLCFTPSAVGFSPRGGEGVSCRIFYATPILSPWGRCPQDRGVLTHSLCLKSNI
jgi:hypothetical protein